MIIRLLLRQDSQNYMSLSGYLCLPTLVGRKWTLYVLVKAIRDNLGFHKVHYFTKIIILNLRKLTEKFVYVGQLNKNLFSGITNALLTHLLY